MGITGNLKTMEVSELLQWIAQGVKTGNLLIDDGTNKKQIYFVDGKIVASSSTSPSEFLGHFLVSHGFITEEELDKAMEIQASSGMLLGKILVTIGAITEDELRDILVMKTEESIYDVFGWMEGDFKFVEDETLEKGNIPIALDVTALTLQGINRVDEWKRIREVIKSADAIPVTTAEIPTDKLSPSEVKINSLVDDDRTIREICMHAHASEFQVCQALFKQHQAGRMKFVTPRRGHLSSASSSPTGTVTPHSDLSSSAMKLVNAEALIESARVKLDSGDFTRALHHLRAALSLEPENRAIEAHLEQAESRIHSELEKAGLTMQAVPDLAIGVEEMTDLDLSPEEGFALSRVNGSYNLQSLIRLSPMGALDAQLVFLKLVRDGHIKVKTS